MTVVCVSDRADRCSNPLEGEGLGERHGRELTGLNRWKQHLIGGCCGKTIELDEGSDRASADAVTWRTIAPASEGA